MNILEEILEDSKESKRFFPELKKRSQVRKDSTSGLTTFKNRLRGYFCSETISHLSHRELTDSEIKFLEKGLGFVQIQHKINEAELRCNFNEFCRRMRLKWHFPDEPKVLTRHFTPKSTWHPSKRHACLKAS